MAPSSDVIFSKLTDLREQSGGLELVGYFRPVKVFLDGGVEFRSVINRRAGLNLNKGINNCSQGTTFEVPVRLGDTLRLF